MSERTFVMVKPDAMARRLLGAIIGRYEAKGLKLVGMKFQVVSRELAEQHYVEHRDKPFYNDLVGFITSGPSVAMVWEGPGAVDMVRAMNGVTNSAKAAPGTIRGDLGLATQQNLVHASDSLETAEREIALYFNASDLREYTMPDEGWLGILD